MNALGHRLAQRDAGLWAAYARRLLFVMTVGLGLMAVVSFIAHNWTYLATTAKLGLIFALIIAACVQWVWKRFDPPVAMSAGIAAQVGIGVWLAGAGQLYQAPGGVQSLMVNWAILGLPFALASKNSAHWALWFGLIFIASVSAPSSLMDWAGDSQAAWRYQFLIGGIALGLAMAVSIWRETPGWFSAWLAAGSGTLFFICVMAFLFDDALFHPIPFIAMIVVSALVAFAYSQRRALAGLSILSVSLLAQLVMIALYLGLKGSNFAVGGMGYSLLIVGLGTAALYALFTHYMDRFGVHAGGKKPDEGDESVENGSAQPRTEAARPWYMDTFVAIGGVLTAILGAAFLASFLGAILSITNQVEIGLIVIGVIIYGSALYARTRADGLFLQYLLGTVLIIGGASLIGGIGALLGSEIAAAYAAIILATLTLWLIAERVMQVVMAVTIAGALSLLIEESYALSQVSSDIPLFVTIGGTAIFWMGQTMKDRFAAAAVLMVSLVIASVLMSVKFWGISAEQEAFSFMTWAARSGPIFLLGLAALFALKRFILPTLPSAPILIITAIVGAIMPAGGMAVILLLMIGLAVGSRSLALIGALTLAGWVLWTYFDFGLTLMQLSGAFALGAVVSGALYYVAPRLRETAP